MTRIALPYGLSDFAAALPPVGGGLFKRMMNMSWFSRQTIHQIRGGCIESHDRRYGAELHHDPYSAVWAMPTWPPLSSVGGGLFNRDKQWLQKAVDLEHEGNEPNDCPSLEMLVTTSWQTSLHKA